MISITLTRQLLGFARGGKYEVKPSDINELIRKSAEMFGRTRKEIVIRSRYHSKIWTVDVDQGQMDQVLMNLYVNAWQAMPGGGTLILETDNVVLDENYMKPFSINGHAEDIMNRGCDAFIQKPYNVKELSNKLEEVLI